MQRYNVYSMFDLSNRLTLHLSRSKIDKSHPNPIHQFLSWQLQESQCDLLEQLVRFDPNQRPSAFQALRHPYLDDLHDEDAAELKVEGAFRISTKMQGDKFEYSFAF